MTSKPPTNALQAALFARLKNDATLTGLIGGRVYDEVPEGTTSDYVTLGDHLSTPDNDLTSFGRETTVTVHVWTRADGMKRGQTIANRINELLDHQESSLSVAGHDVVAIRQDFDQALRDPDQAWRHHVLRFRITTAQQEG